MLVSGPSVTEGFALQLVWGWPVSISDSDITSVLAAYLARYPDEAEQLAEPMRHLEQSRGFASRRSFPLHVTVGALLVRDDTEILLVEHLATGSYAARWSS